MIDRFFNSQTKTITFAAVLLSFSAGVSALLGLIRDRLLAHRLGAGIEVDIYAAAFRIPDFVYGILIMGGISAVFLPVFSEYFRKGEEGKPSSSPTELLRSKSEGEEEAWRFANNLLNCFLALLLLTCGVLFIFAPCLINLIAPGFSPEEKSTTAALTRILFLSPIFFGLSSIFSGILHYFNRFLAYSLAPILYNLGIIFGILFFLPHFGLQGLAYGVILGAVFYWLSQIPAAKNSGYKYLPLFNFKQPGLIKVFKLMIPRTIGAAAYHLNLIVVTAIASTLSVGSIAVVLYYSNNLQQIPAGLIGVSFALAAFPTLSRAWVNGVKEEFVRNFSLTFRQILFLIIPISLLMFLLRAQIVRLILGTGQFGWSETRLTAASLGIFCLGIFASAFIPFLARVFYSFQDTKTPLAIGLISITLNIALSLLFVSLLRSSGIFQEFMINILRLQGIKNIAVIGLPLALSISGIFQFSLLLIFLKKRVSEIKLEEIWQSLKKILTATFLMGIFVYLALWLAANLVDTKTFSGIFIQTMTAGIIGILTYVLIAYILDSPEIKTIKSSILKQFTQ